jgi:hypothetical protein
LKQEKEKEKETSCKLSRLFVLHTYLDRFTFFEKSTE